MALFPIRQGVVLEVSPYPKETTDVASVMSRHETTDTKAKSHCATEGDGSLLNFKIVSTVYFDPVISIFPYISDH